jgi:glycosyltransferase involved in cell wall biosynthesis
MRIITLICARNEADRYLAECLEWNSRQCDELMLFDDCSTDDTFNIAYEAGAIVVERHASEPSFAEGEGAFRMAAWRSMEQVLLPETGDWIICLDADEFLIGDLQDFLSERRETALKIHVQECFGEIDGVPQIRKDGFWGDIWGARIGRYRPGLQYAPISLGGGSLPQELSGEAVPVVGASILHYGYRRAEDRQRKYDSYTAHAGRHSTRHIESIITKPSLEPWSGPVPVVAS